MTNKKNQHYLPKSYLRNFSTKKNRRQIGVYNLKSSNYTLLAPLKNQASKKFFYGKDGELENSLATLESEFAVLLNQILENNILPIKGSKKHEQLLGFIALTILRNPVEINSANNLVLALNEKVKEFDSDHRTIGLGGKMSHNASLNLTLSQLLNTIELYSDLSYKLIRNESQKPFITSDFPIVKYNQFLEYNKWPLGKLGNGSIGLQMFFPISSELMIMLYDSSVYKVGTKRSFEISITNEEEILQLNTMQMLNCMEHIFFNERCEEEYVNTVHNYSKKYQKANIAEAIPFKVERDPDQSIERSLFISQNKDSLIKLKIDQIKIHGNGKKIDLGDPANRIRKKVLDVVNRITRYYDQ